MSNRDKEQKVDLPRTYTDRESCSIMSDALPLDGIASTAVEIIPNPVRVFSALRNLGYSFNSAVADLVDNSISASSSEIVIDFKRVADQFHLSIADNGCGMSARQLREAMRLGSEEEYEIGDLGKFGMGLKTASLSQCRRLSVYSKPQGGTKMSASVWDLDHIARTNRWEVIELSQKHLHLNLPPAVSLSETGTVVIWDRLDRLEGEYASFQKGGAASNWFGRILGDLKLHLRMVFHRFLDGSVRKKHRVTLTFNGEPLSPWDPFCRTETNTVALPIKEFHPTEASQAKVLITPFILPVKEGSKGFSTLSAWQEASGSLPWNDSQGYYVYREDRLIHYGGWLRTRAKDEHIKYARIGILFGSDLDEIFNISVNKSQLKLPASLAGFLKTDLNPEVIKAAQFPYREAAKAGESGSRHRRGTQIVNEAAPQAMAKQSVNVQQRGENDVVVTNRKGSYVANSVADGLKLHVSKRFSVQPGIVEDGRLWKLICKPDGGFVVILNVDHPFYKATYDSGQFNTSTGSFMDAVLFAMAYAELASAGNGTRALFAEIRDTVSVVLSEVASATSST